VRRDHDIEQSLGAENIFLITKSPLRDEPVSA